MVVGAEDGGPADLLCLGMATHHGDPVALIFPGDAWAPDATALLSAALTPTGVVYADEDRLLHDGTYGRPRLKPDFSPDFLLSSSYIGRPLAIGSELVQKFPHFHVPDSDALEHAYALYASEVAETVTHLSEVLCHRTDHDLKHSEGGLTTARAGRPRPPG